jgi:HD-GYP domain-containing protein (c-di-GMP phosphodiesterase class II)
MATTTHEQGCDSDLAPHEEPRSLSSPWHILERLMQELQQSTQVVQQIRSTLEAVRESTGADVVYCQPTARHGEPIAIGDNRLSLQACQRFVTNLVQQTGAEQGHLLWSTSDGRDGAAPVPCSAALVRVGSANSAWLVAISLDPRRHFQASDLDLLSLARRILVTKDHQTKLYARLRDSLAGLVRCLTATLDAKDSCTAGHSERVARIGQLLGRHMGLPAKTVNTIFLAGLLHDLGKIGVPDRVLMKAGQLTRKEFALIQEHTTVGDRILSNVRQLEHVRPGVRSHHERFDGKGYPDGLAGDTIPLLGRVLAVADSCDAMMSPRRYRPALAPPQIDALFLQGAGKQWDPTVVEHFMACRHQIYPPIYRKGIDESTFHAVVHLAESHGEGSSMFFKAFVPDTAADAEQEG